MEGGDCVEPGWSNHLGVIIRGGRRRGRSRGGGLEKDEGVGGVFLPEGVGLALTAVAVAVVGRLEECRGWGGVEGQSEKRLD
jgi:hypothetical protein